ncbi:MAG TPA: flippase [Pyrinomonadaceae bacterium]|nr:flippase [Pyrinomonadaceae bacterium]
MTESGPINGGPEALAHPGSSAAATTRFSLNVAWTFAARILMVFNSVLAGIVVARWLGASGVGELAVINVAVSTIVQLGAFGLPSSNTYFIARDQEHFRAAAVNSLIFALLVGAVLALGLMATASLRPNWFGFVSPDLIRIAAISIPFQILTLIGLNIFLALERIREFNLLDLIGQSFVLINALAALVVFRRGLNLLVALNTAAAIFVSLVIMILLIAAGRTVLPTKWRADFRLLARMVSYGIKFHLSILAGTLIFRADLLVVNHFRGSVEAGVYSVASQFALMLMLLPGVIATLIFPRITSAQDQHGETTSLVMRHTAFVMAICCLVAIPLSLLLPVLYGAAFNEAITQLLIMLPGIYLVSLQSVLVQHFNALGLPRIILLYWLITLVINVVLVFAVVPQYGARGAAVVSAVSYGLIFALVAIRFRLTTQRSWSNIFLLRRDELRQLFWLGTRMVTSLRGSR